MLREMRSKDRSSSTYDSEISSSIENNDVVKKYRKKVRKVREKVEQRDKKLEELTDNLDTLIRRVNDLERENSELREKLLSYEARLNSENKIIPITTPVEEVIENDEIEIMEEENIPQESDIPQMEIKEQKTLNYTAALKAKVTSTIPSTSRDIIEVLEEEMERTETTKPKIPPVTIDGNDDWGRISRSLNDKKIEYTKAKTTKTGVKIFPSTIDSYRKLINYLNNIGKHYFTYTLEEDINIHTVVQGLPLNSDIQEIKNEFKLA
ncbi:hypothetical protein WA026_001892 [Henosepilachna vigintioctopunctata]|uniref:Uncharacterized protein n=1 Tax=Henosepilachna vigintioctopunctata TaxID=420089 RepID=A0AAW1UMG9_9CUCU